MKPVIYTLLGLTLVAIGWFSASAKPPEAIAPSPDEAGQSAEQLADLPLPPSAPPALEPLLGGQTGGFMGEGDLNRAVLGKGRYLQLAQQYADLMTEREIAAESGELEQKILLKRSEASLRSVRRSLQSIILQFPSTPAAEQAQRALERLDAPIPNNTISDDAGQSAEPLADLPLSPSAPPTIKPQVGGQQGGVMGEGDLNRAVLGRGRYLQLAQQYADLMTEHEIAAESAALEQKIVLKRSESSLWSIRRSLRELMKEFPSTRAAERAQRALELLDAPIPNDTISDDAAESR